MQLSFGDAEDLGGRKRTRREVFLAEMDQVVPWKALLALIEPHYPKRGPGGMVSVWLKGGFGAAKRFMERTELFACAESLGGVESIANSPAVMTHTSVPEERREALGVTDNLVRLSVGVEDLADLRAEPERAFG